MNQPPHNRKLTRLRGYDYSQDGYYFITVCVKNRLVVFGKINNGEMVGNKFADVVRECWLDLPNHYPNCVLHAFMVMPNHIHGIIQIDNDKLTVGNGLKPFPESSPNPAPRKHGLSEMVRALKSFSSRRINEIAGFRFQWQKSFYDHIIRDEESFVKISEYILYNPAKWHDDRFYVE